MKLGTIEQPFCGVNFRTIILTRDKDHYDFKNNDSLIHTKVFHVQGRFLKCKDFLTHINIRSPVVEAVKLMACNAAPSPLKISS